MPQILAPNRTILHIPEGLPELATVSKSMRKVPFKKLEPVIIDGVKYNQYMLKETS